MREKFPKQFRFIEGRSEEFFFFFFFLFGDREGRGHELNWMKNCFQVIALDWIWRLAACEIVSLARVAAIDSQIASFAARRRIALQVLAKEHTSRGSAIPATLACSPSGKDKKFILVSFFAFCFFPSLRTEDQERSMVRSRESAKRFD